MSSFNFNRIGTNVKARRSAFVPVTAVLHESSDGDGPIYVPRHLRPKAKPDVLIMPVLTERHKTTTGQRLQQDVLPHSLVVDEPSDYLPATYFSHAVTSVFPALCDGSSSERVETFSKSKSFKRSPVTDVVECGAYFIPRDASPATHQTSADRTQQQPGDFSSSACGGKHGRRDLLVDGGGTPEALCPTPAVYEQVERVPKKRRRVSEPPCELHDRPDEEQLDAA